MVELVVSTYMNLNSNHSFLKSKIGQRQAGYQRNITSHNETECHFVNTLEYL